MRPFPKNCLRLLLMLAVVLGVGVPALAGNFKSSGAPTITLTNQNTGSSGVSYTFSLYAATTASSIKRFEFQTQTSASVNALPSGMSLTSVGSSAATTGLGGLTFTYDAGNSTPASGLIKFTNATGSTPTNPMTITVTNITNPTTAATYYFQVSTYTATTGGSLIDQDIIGFTISPQSVTLSTSIGETLTLTINNTAAAFGAISTSSVSTASPNTVVTVGTNATGGYQVIATGTPLTSGALTIPWLTDSAVDGTNSSTPTSEYGLSLSSCAAGATCPSGDQSAASALTIISRAAADSSDSVTVSYKAQAKVTQPPSQSYASTVNYVATGLF